MVGITQLLVRKSWDNTVEIVIENYLVDFVIILEVGTWNE